MASRFAEKVMREKLGGERKSLVTEKPQPIPNTYEGVHAQMEKQQPGSSIHQAVYKLGLARTKTM
jgi:hypothetical protein